jgi:hypothetical protein
MAPSKSSSKPASKKTSKSQSKEIEDTKYGATFKEALVIFAMMAEKDMKSSKGIDYNKVAARIGRNWNGKRLVRLIENGYRVGSSGTNKTKSCGLSKDSRRVNTPTSPDLRTMNLKTTRRMTRTMMRRRRMIARTKVMPRRRMTRRVRRKKYPRSQKSRRRRTTTATRRSCRVAIRRES